MIELDRVLWPISKLINDAYEQAFPNLPMFPKFSLTRSITTLWITKTYNKLKDVVPGALGELLYEGHQELMETLKQQVRT